MQDFVVPEAQDQIPLLREYSVTHDIPFVMLVRPVLTTIQFDGDARAMFRKIGKVVANRCLPAKVKPAPVQFAKFPPEKTFGFRHLTAQLACAFEGSRFEACSHLPPTRSGFAALTGSTSPQGGGYYMQLYLTNVFLTRCETSKYTMKNPALSIPTVARNPT